MAQQLRDRLDAVFTDAPWRHVRATGGWQNVVGARIVAPRSMVVHETSGWPSRINGENMFNVAFLAGAGHPHTGETTQLYVSGDGTVQLGMELPRTTWHANFVNDWAFGAETGHGWGNYRNNARLGPFTSTNETLIANPLPPPPQIVHGGLIAPRAKPGNIWIALSGDGTIDAPGDDDFPGIKLFVRHQAFNEVVVGIWTTPRYAGPWRQPQRVPEMLFTDAHYRSWALLARWIAEEYLIPRNFSLLPHKLRNGGFGESGNHGMIRDGASFAAIVLADEGLSRSPQTFGLPAATIPTAAALQANYTAAATANRNPRWTALFDVFRGFHGHGYSGDPNRGNDHDCPGPMFDWHRFAREVWDWWWFPFDFDPLAPDAAVAARPYSLATRDGNTPLREYFWSTPEAVPLERVRLGIHGTRGSPQTFELPQNSRIYALANGELVAARFPAETGRVSLAFMLVRHEVFHQIDPRPPAPGTPATLPVFANRIDYDVAPSSVYSLYMHLGRPPGMSFDTVSADNPDWLNRVIARKTEARLGVNFRASAAGTAIPIATWNNRPPSATGRRPTLIEAWTANNDGLTTFLNTLRAGDLAVVPFDADTTPIRILLGDYMANAGVISRDQAATRRGVRVEVFSNTLISNLAADFLFTDTSATEGGWQPAAGTGEPAAVRYASEWARTPSGAELLSLLAAGVDTGLVNWWPTVQLATLNPRLPADAQLNPQGIVVHYDPLTFLPWLNTRTWRSEWPKYRAVDPTPGGIPAAPRPR